MLSIIIVNYKSERQTIEYVLYELTKVKLPHIVVIVNNSATKESDGLLSKELDAELVNDINKPVDKNQYRFIVSHSENLGFAKGNNLGSLFSLNHFDIDYFLFSNNDIRFIDNNVVETLIEKLSVLSDIGMIGPRVVGLDGKNQSPEPYYSMWKKYVLMYWLTPFLSKQRKKQLFQMDYSQKATEGKHYKIMGSFFIVKAPEFIECGMMDPNTFLYGEEVILSERLLAINKYSFFYPVVSVVHEHSQTITQYYDNKKSILEQFKSESYYYRVYKGVSRFSVLLGKLSLNLYLKLKKKK